MRAPSLGGLILLGSSFVYACGGGSSDNKGLGGQPDVAGCDSDADCDDSFYCNGVEVCDEGICRQGTRIACDDGIECTVDRCDEGTKACASSAKDADGDGHGVAGCVDAESKPLGDDCNDDDALVFPGNDEVCDPDNRDEDCNPKTLGDRDTDGDGYFDAVCCNEQKNGKLECGDDCDDHRANVSPEAVEACDGFDNDCDGKVDDGVSVDMYPDLDHDGHGDSEADAVKSCPGAVGLALVANDCDDTDPEVFEGQFEICDEKDNNCDASRLIDEVQEQAPWYVDVDKDGYGDPLTSPVFSCSRPEGRVLSYNDCDDTKKKVNPNATEICDALDNDCNGLADFRVGSVANNFEDNDGDGVADADCGGGDCDDTNPYTAVGAPEFCDFIDNDCDDAIDEDVVTNIWYVDNDGDGWGVGFGTAIASCVPIAGLSNKYGDCNDGNANALPGGVEFCDGVDQDCDGVVDDGATAYCQLENAVSRCYHGACRVYTCTAGFKDADGDPANGCEAPVSHGELYTGAFCTTNADCSDGKYCTGTETCFEGGCYRGNPVNCEVGDGIVQGNVTIKNGVDLKLLEGVTTITGDVTIDGTALVNLIGLESLRVIGGDLYIYNNSLLLKLSGSALSGLELIGGRLTVSTNPSLKTIYLPSLVSLGSFEVTDYYEGGGSPLEAIDFPSLVQIEGELRIAPSGPVFASVSMPKLTRVDRIDIQYDNPSTLKTMDFGSLTTVDRWIDVNAPIGAPGATFSMNKLRVVGSKISSESGLPLNNGIVNMCVGALASPCSVLENLGNLGGHTGARNDCGACPLAATIAAGEHHACALVAGGEVKCWGYNDYGEVGAPPLDANASPTAVGLANAIELAVGNYHSCALITDGTVKCWGDNSNKQLGVGVSPSFSKTPVTVPGLSNVKMIRAGGDGTCALKKTGEVICWGGIYYGSPAAFANLEGIGFIDVGPQNGCAIDVGGTLRCWGENTMSQLGTEYAPDTVTPVRLRKSSEPVTYVNDAAFITVGFDHSCMRLANGNVDCIGSLEYDKGGPASSGTMCGSVACADYPLSLGWLVNAKSVSAGYKHTCGVSSGVLQCFGDGSVGQTGSGYNIGSTGVEVILPAGESAREVAAGNEFTCVRTVSEGVYCFGMNTSNQLGYDLSVTPTPPSTSATPIFAAITTQVQAPEL